MDTTEQIHHKIGTLPYDLRAEAVLSSVLETIAQDDNAGYFVNPLGRFRRPYSKDIAGSGVEHYETDGKRFLRVDLSRNGLYDMLPEGMLHYYYHQRKDISADEMAKYYRERKEEEASARLFFLPFENEFFGYALECEQREQQYLLHLNGERPVAFMYDFWGIDKQLPGHIAARFICLLPYVHEIAGNISLTEQCLAYLLRESVSIVPCGYTEGQAGSRDSGLGGSRLGVDFVSGDRYLDYTVTMNIVIGPLVHADLQAYTGKGPMRKLLELYYEYLFPAEIEIKTTILPPPEQEVFKMDNKRIPVLGITTRI